MSIRRGRWTVETNYLQYPNAWARDARLSRRARGLLVELSSHKAGWEVTLESLMEHGTEGREALRTAIAELEEFGYLRREKQKTQGGQFAGIDYILAEPEELQSAGIGKADIGGPYIGQPTTKKTKSLEDKLFEEDYVVATATQAPKRPVSVPASFSLDDLMVMWAHKNTPLVLDLQTETGKFTDWSRAHGKKYTDWTAAWRNWMRKANAYAAEKFGPTDNVGSTRVESKRIADDFYSAEGYTE